CLQDLEYPLTF
nr:immunoglobulin light chain junction region [Macaca mulatta]MOW63525.1 immunoglobulin light chain junction region [Macaca mulatta]MOW64154.1 immunoglobulin light chain junction region [Macaca mulatta]